METQLRTDLLAWLAADAELSAGLNAIAEEAAKLQLGGRDLVAPPG